MQKQHTSDRLEVLAQGQVGAHRSVLSAELFSSPELFVGCNRRSDSLRV